MSNQEWVWCIGGLLILFWFLYVPFAAVFFFWAGLSVWWEDRTRKGNR